MTYREGAASLTGESRTKTTGQAKPTLSSATGPRQHPRSLFTWSAPGGCPVDGPAVVQRAVWDWRARTMQGR